MDNDLARYATLIRDKLDDILEKEKHFFKDNYFAQDLFDRLKIFVRGGKTWRGAVIALTSEILTGKLSEQSIEAGAAIEMFQAACLIHDDIMDRDFIRRGRKTIFAQYKELADEENFKEPLHFGSSLGICAGDVCISLIFKTLNNLEINEKDKKEIIKIFSNSLTNTGLGQMDDIYTSSLKEVSIDRIISMNKNKTAIYTFAAPLVVGAILGGVGDEEKEKLYSIGLDLGIIFQIKNDEADLFGDEESIGKSLGGDLVENKKTLFRLFLFSEASKEDKLKFDRIFGNPRVSKEDINFVRSKITEYGVDKLVSAEIGKYEASLREKIDNLNIDEKLKYFLKETLDHSLKG